MDKPKSIEVSRVLGWEFLKRTAEHKGTPGERVVQKRILKGLAEIDGFNETEGGGFEIKSPNEFPNEEEIGKDKMPEAIAEFQKKQQDWMSEKVFAELGKKERAWLWKILYVKDFEGEMEPGQELKVEEAATALGKLGSFRDMQEDVEEWEDSDEDEEE